MWLQSYMKCIWLKDKLFKKSSLFTISIKILGVNFGNSILEQNYSKNVHIWNRVRLSLRSKKIIVNQKLLSKLWYIGQNWTIPKCTKKEYTISSGTGKNTISLTSSSTLHLDNWTRHFRQRDTIKLSQNKMDSKVIKSNQCSLEKSHGVSIKLNSELKSRSGPF